MRPLFIDPFGFKSHRAILNQYEKTPVPGFLALFPPAR